MTLLHHMNTHTVFVSRKILLVSLFCVPLFDVPWCNCPTPSARLRHHSGWRGGDVVKRVFHSVREKILLKTHFESETIFAKMMIGLLSQNTDHSTNFNYNTNRPIDTPVFSSTAYRTYSCITPRTGDRSIFVSSRPRNNRCQDNATTPAAEQGLTSTHFTRTGRPRRFLAGESQS